MPRRSGVGYNIIVSLQLSQLNFQAMKYNTNTSLKQHDELRPEQKRIFALLETLFPCWSSYVVDSISNDIIKAEAAGFTEFPMSMNNIPSGSGWQWRQSNAKTSVFLNPTTIATMIKFNTKKTHPTSQNPSFKFWIVELALSNQKHIWFIYCEKGMNPASFELQIQPVEPVVDIIELENLLLDCSNDTSTLPELIEFQYEQNLSWNDISFGDIPNDCKPNLFSSWNAETFFLC